MKVNKKILIFRITSLIIIIMCIVILIIWQKHNVQNKSISTELNSFLTVENLPSTSFSPQIGKKLSVNFEELKKQNSDTVGWIYFNNINISYPIVQSTDNSFYLKHNFNKESNGAGWIFADSTNNMDELDQNTIIYGHNRLDGSMFANLRELLDTSSLEDPSNQYFCFSTINHSYVASIFSIYKISTENVELKNNYQDTEEFLAETQSWQNNSIYNFNLTPSANDKIITLYTCDNDTSYRILVHAILIEVE